MKVFVNPHAETTAEIESWNITEEETEQVSIIRNGRVYVLLFAETPSLEIWSVEQNGDFGKVLQTVQIPVIHEQLEFEFVKNMQCGPQ